MWCYLFNLYDLSNATTKYNLQIKQFFMLIISVGKSK